MNIYDEWLFSMSFEELKFMLKQKPQEGQSPMSFICEVYSAWDNLGNDQKQSIWYEANNMF
jgi:hypothetical protein